MSLRPQGLQLDAGDDRKPIVQEPVALRGRDRLGIPMEVMRSVSWLNRREPKVESLALGIFDRPGRFVLRDWGVHGQSVLDERRTLVDRGDLSSLRLLEEVFKRLLISGDGRITLTLTQLLHLGIKPGDTAHLFVTAVADDIEIATVDFRNGILQGAAVQFSALLPTDGG
jgi:hypothetical protein